MSSFVEVSARLRAERERLKLKQEEFAEQMGVSRTSQSNYERGERSPDLDYLAKAATLGVDALYVITGNRSRATPLPAAPAYDGGAIRGESLSSVLTAEESALVDNFRHASQEGRRALAAAGAALSQSEPVSKDAA